MILERPDLLLLAPATILLLSLAIVAQWRRGVRLVQAYGGPQAATRLLGRRLDRLPVVRWMALMIASVALVVVVAGPEREPAEEVPITPVDLVIAIDLSHSMTATDVEPSRIGRAQELVRRIVEERVADRVALVLFADWSYDLVPLTDDENVVTFFSPFVSPDLITGRDQGTSLAPLVTHAVTTWQERSRSDAIPLLLVVSDGEVHGASRDVLTSVDSAVEAGMHVWTAGAGSASGGALFVPRSNAPLLDGSGRPIVAEYDAALLEEVAARGGGTFRDVSDDAGLRRLVSDLEDVGGQTATVETAPAPSGAWMLLLALGLLVVEATLDTGVLGRVAGGVGRR